MEILYSFVHFFFQVKWMFTNFSDLKYLKKKTISGLSVNLEANNIFRYVAKTLGLTDHQYHSSH